MLVSYSVQGFQLYFVEKTGASYVYPICPETEVVFPFILRLKLGTLSSKEIAFTMLKKLHQVGAKVYMKSILNAYQITLRKTLKMCHGI